MIPVPVTEFKVCLASQREERDFVQYGFHPETLDQVFQASQVVVAAAVIYGREFDLDLVCGAEAEAFEVLEICVVEVRTGFAEEVDFFGFDGYVFESLKERQVSRKFRMIDRLCLTVHLL